MSSLSRLRAAAVLLGLPFAFLSSPVVGQESIQLPGLYVESATIRARTIQPKKEPAAVPEVPQPSAADDVEGIPLAHVGSAVSVVTAADLERQQIQNAHDALRSLPGVSVSQQGTPGSLTVVRIRGAESRHTLVLIDGVEVNSGTDGFFDFSNLSAADIERIEVLRGPQGGLHGNSAIGGVISITTKSGRGPLALRVQTEVGTQRTGSATAQLSGGNEKAWGSVVVHGLNTDGFNISPIGDEDDGSRVRSFAARGGIALSDSFRIEGTVREHNRKAEFDEGFKQLYRGYFAPGDAPYSSDARLRVGSLQATLDTFNKTWVHNFYIQGAETDRLDVGSSPLETNSTNAKVGYKSTLLLEPSSSAPFRHFLTGMIEQRKETFHQPTFSDTTYSRDRDTIAAELRGEYFKSLFLSGTVRHEESSDFGDYTTWHVSGSYLVPGGVFRLHSSAGTGVKYPSFGDLYGFFIDFEPNPNLRPEESLGYDFGVETTLLNGRAVIDVTYFHADLTNEIFITCQPNPKAQFTCTPKNRGGESTRRGLEVAARYALTPQLAIGGAYTYLLAREDSGLEEIRRPPHSGRIDLNYSFMQRRGNLNIAAIYNGEMLDLVTDADFKDHRVPLENYWSIQVAASYKLQPGVQVFGRVENLLDDQYQEVFGYNATPGMAAFAGIKLTFGGEEGIGGRWAN